MTREFAPMTGGGIGALTRRLVADLDGAGFSCVLLLDIARSQSRRARNYAARALPSVDVFAVDELVGDRLPSHAFRSEAYWRSYRIWRALVALFARSRIEVVEFPDFEGLGFVTIKAKRLGLGAPIQSKLIVRIHGTAELAMEADGYFRYAPALLQTYEMERYCLRHAEMVLSPSEHVKKWYSEHYTLSDRVVHSVPPSERQGPGNAHRLPSVDPPLKLLFLGKLQPLKGVKELVGATVACLERRGVGSIEVRLVGEDSREGAGRNSYRSELGQLIPKEFSACFKFHGRSDQAELPRLAAECDAAVFPSRMETFCLAAHELNWVGIPLILSGIPAFRAYFRAGEDALFFDGTERGLETLLDSLIDSREALTRLSWNAPRARSDSATFYQSLLEEVVKAPAKRKADSGCISVVVPYCDMHDYVDDALISIEASEYENWELILVDDGSSSVEGKEKFAEVESTRSRDSRFRFVRKANGGVGSARNAGIALARGDYVLPLDPDDMIHPSYLVRAADALSLNPDLGFVSCFAAIFRDGKRASSAREWFIPYDPHPALLLYENGAGTAACVFRRGVFATRRYDERLPAYEDWDLQLSLARDGVAGEVIPEVLFFYRMRRSSLARTHAHVFHDMLLSQMLDKHFPELPENAREAFMIYIQACSEARGLGARGIFFSRVGLRPRVAEAARTLYVRWLKEPLGKHLSERRQRQLVTLAKRLITSGATRRP